MEESWSKYGGKLRGLGKTAFQGEKLTNKSISVYLSVFQVQGNTVDFLDVQYTNFNTVLFKIRMWDSWGNRFPGCNF